MNIKKHLSTSVGIAALGVLALVAGAGSAVGPGHVVPLPDGITAAPGVAATPMPDPTYSVNAKGLTYGSVAQAPSPDKEPALVAVTATNGIDGYAYKKDLDDADGTTAQKSFKSPQDAISWQETEGQLDHSVPVYKSDGTTLIGEFVVGGVKTVTKQLQEDPAPELMVPMN